MNVLFFGELPTKNIHGVSLSNKINLEIISTAFSVDIIEEIVDLREHGKFSINKNFSFFLYCLRLIKFSLKKHYHFFYTTFSLSLAGAIKTFMLQLLFKLFNPKGKIVLHLHRGDFISFYYRKHFFTIISNIIFKASHKIVFLSESFIDRSLPYSEKFVVVPNTLIIPEQIIRNESKTDFVFISNYIKEKGILELLEAFNQLNEESIYLNCYGQFTTFDLRDKVQSYASKKIRLNNFVNNENEKYSIVCSSKCVILPSYNEGQPLIILEAMAMGVPVIATKVGDIPEMLGQNYPYLIEPSSIQSLKEAIEKIGSLSSTEIFEIGERLKKRFEEKYSFDKHKSLLLAAFE